MNIWKSIEIHMIEFKRLYIWILLSYMLIYFNCASAQKFHYIFEKVENSEIRFYNEVHNDDIILEESIEDINLNIFYGSYSDLNGDLIHFFAYKTDNFIRFKVLDDILVLSASECSHGKIECSFNLLHLLELTKDISSLPDVINHYQIKCLLLIFNYFRVIDDKNIVHFLQGIFFKTFFYQNANEKNKILDLEEIFGFITIFKIDSYIKRNFISAYFKSLAIEHVFYEENVVFLSNKKEMIDFNLFNDHIPYKNLLINNCKILCNLENILTNRYILESFKILFKAIDIKSLIINNHHELITDIIDFHFFNQTLCIFKSIIFSNFSRSSEFVLYELSRAYSLNLKYFGLKNLSINIENLDIFTRKQELKGLLFNNVTFIGGIDRLQSFIGSNEALDFVDFENVQTDVVWETNFVKTSKIKKIVLSFNSYFMADEFIKNTTIFNFPHELIQIEIRFDFFVIPEEFLNILCKCRFLKTLKLLNYELKKNINQILFKIIGNMKELETLWIEYDDLGDEIYNYLFKIERIKILKLNNSFYRGQTLNLATITNYKCLTELVLYNIRISENTLNEIFKYENLEVFSLELCDIRPIKSIKSIFFRSRNLKKLHLSGSILSYLKDKEILSKLNHLEILNLDNCTHNLCFLTKLSSHCNLRLLRLSVKSSVLCMNDLKRITMLEVLEDLNFYECRFFRCSFWEMGEYFKSFYSLLRLNLSGIELTANDIRYLKNFKNLKELFISPFYWEMYQINYGLKYLSRIYFYSKLNYDKRKKEIYFNYLYEKNILGIFE
ncbi:hypothetical protein CWI39_0094p0010 [Hamiltosporidium magnivora]|uniref:Leucine-rich repeat-containing protein n=1 Tax=Hamiltosporidium magnivora TaxID=148818 RepID=A0A4Q9LPD8_9MICR|nr:hypothetical protein CWI39_0094p0010 [Hamiltosporidium magnivora]